MPREGYANTDAQYPSPEQQAIDAKQELDRLAWSLEHTTNFREVWERIDGSPDFRSYLARSSERVWRRTKVQQRRFDAEDIVHNAWIFLAEWVEKDGDARRFEWQGPDKARNLLSKLARIACLQARRKLVSGNKDVVISSVADKGLDRAAEPDPTPEETETRARLSKAIDDLGEPDRAIMWLWLFEQLTQQAIADILDISPDKVYRTIRRDTQKLRIIMGLHTEGDL